MFFAKFVALLLSLSFPVSAVTQGAVIWRFDNLTGIGGNSVVTEGSPGLVKTDLGTAVHFTGNSTSGDGLFLNVQPLAGASSYTWEVIFRPATGGVQAQRFFHLQEAPSQSRRLFELRIVDTKWCLDAFGTTVIPGQPQRSATILKCDAGHLFPLDQWYAVAAVYDGKVLRSYVNGMLQGEAEVQLDPLGPGGTSVGTRYTKRDYFTGDVFSARFTPRALPVSDLIKVPPTKPNNK